MPRGDIKYSMGNQEDESNDYTAFYQQQLHHVMDTRPRATTTTYSRSSSELEDENTY